MLLKAQVLLWLLVATAWGRDFQGGNTIDWGTQNVGQGDVHIHSGALWSIINNAASDFHGNIQVDSNAGLYVSSVTSNVALSATLYDTIYEFVNNGVVSFNAIKGAPGYAFNIIGNKFENNGDLFYSASGEGSVVSTIKTPDFHNTGSLNFYQSMKSDSYVLLGADAKTFINNGQICFTNQDWHQLAGVLGAGCFTAQGQSSFYLQNTALQISEDQIFYLIGGETSIMAVGSIDNPQTFHVRGFGTTAGEANKIGLTATLSSSVPGRAPFAYNARDGILTLYVGLYTQNFEIGTGYDPTKFQIVSDTSREIPQIYLGAVQYNGPPPNSGIPPECKPCKSVPGIPGIDKPPATSYSVSTTATSSTIPMPSATVPSMSTPSSASKATDGASTHGLIKTVTVFETDVVEVTSTFTLTSTVTD
ncbi:Hyphally regulated cell wall protein N-terminal family protein [Candida parapsilosis]|uniref:Hyphal_reg_CWP domain-containing protein n=2 Tax=Candida parapsilosis TaxID=5480 RepID=G8BKI7_CANPC|nr:uncharacterized protein CPAR2_702650 [Candida parapsilosis]KAF6042173.1 Hyphally regulated cell wall protein N-terminal family protein [Candida parapsilosis]KAF6042452.1 Hyphally regulated cell wall protein N-terminal family protein [Candida parapsilosis]KAF6042897.1 Hyphally regulated cell wall protein N-terminal family protein [Candida parapsilosis]KAF6058094.1 Hyphally regulated cell wall protein N-terminal family protein [Candida parapsilosis]KAI5903189.1 Cell wall protein IFF9 [Candida